MDAASLRQSLASEDLPWGRFPIPGQGGDERVIEVQALRAHLRRRGEDVDAATRDRLIESIGGRREAMIDPWSVPARAFDWLRGRGWATNDVYLLPLEAFRERA